MKNLKLYLLICIVSLLPMLLMFTNPNLPHTSDGAMHLARIASYWRELASGQFPVRWSSTFDYGYGTPIFNFFHPLPYYITSGIVGIGFNLVTTLKIAFALSFLLSGVFMLLFAREFFEDDKTAFLVTIMYQFAPFRLVEILVRGSLGGIFSYTFLPIVLYGLMKLKKTGLYRYFHLTAIVTLLLITSHNIVGFVFFGLSVLFVLFFSGNRKKLFVSLGALGAGLLLSGFFVLPAILEHKYTLGYQYTKNLFWNNFPSFINFFVLNLTNEVKYRTAEVAVQIGLFHWIALVIAGIYLVRKKLSKQFQIVTVYTSIVFILTLIFMQPISTLLWEKIDFLRQFQYPWRLLGVINFVTAFAGAAYLLLPLFKKSQVAYITLIVLIIGTTAYYWQPPQGYQKINEQDFWNYPLSTNYFGEVDLVWSEGTAKGYPAHVVDVVAGTAVISDIIKKPIKHTYTVSAQTDATILDRTQFFPGWKVLVDGKDTLIQFQDQNYRGLITYQIPKGNHAITVVFSQSKIQQIGNALTAVTFILLFFPYLLPKKYQSNLWKRKKS
jgi:uncharacterized membrane protein